MDNCITFKMVPNRFSSVQKCRNLCGEDLEEALGQHLDEASSRSEEFLSEKKELTETEKVVV